MCVYTHIFPREITTYVQSIYFNFVTKENYILNCLNCLKFRIIVHWLGNGNINFIIFVKWNTLFKHFRFLRKKISTPLKKDK